MAKKLLQNTFKLEKRNFREHLIPAGFSVDPGFQKNRALRAENQEVFFSASVYWNARELFQRTFSVTAF